MTHILCRVLLVFISTTQIVHALPDHIPGDNEPITAPDIRIPHYEDHTALLNAIAGPLVAIGSIEIAGTSSYADPLTTPIPLCAITCCLNRSVHSKLSGIQHHVGYFMYSMILYGIYHGYLHDVIPHDASDPRTRAAAAGIWGELIAAGMTALQ